MRLEVTPHLLENEAVVDTLEWPPFLREEALVACCLRIVGIADIAAGSHGGHIAHSMLCKNLIGLTLRA